MLSSAVIDIALGLIFVYLVFSLAASRINEFVASRLQWRAEGLERGLLALLDGPSAPKDTPGARADGGPAAAPADPSGNGPLLSAAAIKLHPAVAALDAALEKKRRISYLPSRAFAAVVLDLLAPPAAVLLDRVDPD